MKKIGRVDGKVYRKNVYRVFKNDELVFEGVTDDVIDFLNVDRKVFNTTLWRCRRRKSPLKYKGYTLQRSQYCTGERIFAVVGQHNGKEILRGSMRKIAAEFKYKVATLKNYISNKKPIILRRKKYDLIPTGEYDIVWKRVK